MTGPEATRHDARDTCPHCKSADDAEVRHRDLIWGDAELWCKRCERKIRDMDFG